MPPRPAFLIEGHSQENVRALALGRFNWKRMNEGTEEAEGLEEKLQEGKEGWA